MIEKDELINFRVCLLMLLGLVMACITACTSNEALPNTDGDLDSNEVVESDATEDADIENGEMDSPFTCTMRIGAAKRNITPTVEPYEDTNGNSWRENEESYADTNENGQYDPVYLAGFGARQAQGVHDSLWSRCMAVEANGQAYLFCASDLIGLGLARYDGLVDRISELRPEADIAQRTVHWASTHTHQGPDTQGIWDLMPPEYLDQVVELTAQAAVEALDDMQPGELRFASAIQPRDVVVDIDPPDVKDPTIGIIQGVAQNGDVISTMMSIANHPEAAGSENLLLSSDYPHYLREEIEAEFGGMAIYFSGALGLMQTPSTQSFEDAERIGKAYAEVIGSALGSSDPPVCVSINSAMVRQKLVLENFEFYAGLVSGMIDGFDGYLYDDGDECDLFACIDIPASAILFGDVMTWISVPGEMTPELVIGQYPDPEPVPGEYADYEREPYLEQFITTPNRFISGLCDVEIGYIFPHYQLDPDNHWSQGHSSGPTVAARLMRGYRVVFDRLAETDTTVNGK